jgi:hypothetical protein
MPAEPDRLRYLPGRSRNHAHLIPAWHDGRPVRESRCGLIESRWQRAEEAHRPLCGNCRRNYQINEGTTWTSPSRQAS